MDRHVEAVRAKLAQRAEAGLRKYGTTLERTDLNTLDWLRHAQEEAMDFCVYLERLMADEAARQKREIARGPLSGSIVYPPSWEAA